MGEAGGCLVAQTRGVGATAGMRVPFGSARCAAPQGVSESRVDAYAEARRADRRSRVAMGAWGGRALIGRGRRVRELGMVSVLRAANRRWSASDRRDGMERAPGCSD